MNIFKATTITAAALGLATFAAAQVGTYYTTDGTASIGKTRMYQNGIEVGNFDWATAGQMPIVVGDFGSGNMIRQAVGQPLSGNPESGNEYSLAGVATGTTNLWQCGDTTAYDAAYDGSHIYMVHWGGSTDGQVWRYDANYGNGQYMFTANGQSNGGDLGITYDSTTNTIWTGGFNSGHVQQWSMTGTALAGFNVFGGSASALAFDPQSDTFWLSNGVYGAGSVLNYDRQGNLLGNFVTGHYMLGGEFLTVTPEPASMTVLALGVIAAIKRRKR